MGFPTCDHPPDQLPCTSRLRLQRRRASCVLGYGILRMKQHAPADCFPKARRVRGIVQPLRVFGQVPEGDERVRIATAEGGLETDNPVT